MNDEEEAKLANMAYQFMQRVTLQGNEVPSFLSVVQWLAGKGQKKAPPAPPPVAPPAPPTEM